MKLISLFTILSLISVSFTAEAKCDIFKCATTDVPAGKCVISQTVDGKKQFNIKDQCPNNQICSNDPESGDWVCKAVPTQKGDKLDTEVCQKDNDCYKGLKCTSGKCVGKPNESDCTESEECKVGSSCNTLKCKLQISDDNTDCNNSDQNCVNTHFCHEKKCVPYYSLDNGVIVTTSIERYQCKSREVGKDIEGNYMCQTSTLQGTEWKCASSQNQCKYNIQAKTLTKDVAKDCECTFSDTNQKYCPGDSSKLNPISYTVTGVHTVRRWGNAWFPRVMTWPKFVGADACTIKLLSGSFIKLGIEIVLVLMLLI